MCVVTQFIQSYLVFIIQYIASFGPFWFSWTNLSVYPLCDSFPYLWYLQSYHWWKYHFYLDINSSPRVLRTSYDDRYKTKKWTYHLLPINESLINIVIWKQNTCVLDLVFPFQTLETHWLSIFHSFCRILYLTTKGPRSPFPSPLEDKSLIAQTQKVLLFEDL